MPEVNPPRGADPAARTVTAASPNYSTKTAASIEFRSLLKGPARHSNSASGPPRLRTRAELQQSALQPAVSHPLGAVRRRGEHDPEPESAPSPERPLDPLSCQLAWGDGIAFPSS